MHDRIHLNVGREAKERYRAAAREEGKTLSEWLREAAEERWRAAHGRLALSNAKELRAFFRQCDELEEGREPDWDAHRRVIEQSIGEGRPEP